MLQSGSPFANTLLGSLYLVSFAVASCAVSKAGALFAAALGAEISAPQEIQNVLPALLFAPHLGQGTFVSEATEFMKSALLLASILYSPLLNFDSTI